MCWKSCVGAIMLFSSAGAGCTTPGPLRVMTFNVRYATADDGVDAWEHRRELVVETIRRHAPDVLGLQEPLVSQVKELRSALREYAVVGVGRDDGRERGEFVPIFYRRERFTLVEQGHFWLSPEHDQPGSVGWDAALPRLATWVRLRFNDAPLQKLWVINVHFDHEGEQARVESARMIRRVIDAAGGTPMIVLGDFNCPPDAAPHRILTAERGDLTELRDACERLRPAERAGTYHAFSGEPRGEQIDWILYNRFFKVVEATIDRSSRGARYPSDHFPVVATLRFAPDTCWSPPAGVCVDEAYARR